MKYFICLLLFCFIFSVAEARYVYPKGAKTETEQRVDRRMKRYDSNGDGELSFEDYLKYRESEEQSFDDFRRMNVDKMIKSVSDALKAMLKETGKKVQFGISPFAVYRTHSSIVENGWDKGSYNAASALQCYSELYSDVYKWMKEGWIDYVVPQNYFSFERRDVTYHDVAWWWSNICKETNTILYMGQGIYHLGASEGWGFETWQNPEEINNQLKFNWNFENIKGTIFFT